jgi:chloramphenicol 3-O-phosphotransferase
MRRHEANISALLSGLLFIGLGVYALAVGSDRLGDALRWVWPVLLLGLGVALLAGSSRRQHRAGDEVGAERGEDREVEQAGRRHDS